MSWIWIHVKINKETSITIYVIDARRYYIFVTSRKTKLAEINIFYIRSNYYTCNDLFKCFKLTTIAAWLLQNSLLTDTEVYLPTEQILGIIETCICNYNLEKTCIISAILCSFSGGSSTISWISSGCSCGRLTSSSSTVSWILHLKK